MRKTKTILGISLLVQSLSFFILFIIYWGKRKSLAKTFIAFSAAGGLAGGYLLVSDLLCKKSDLEFDDEEIDEDFADLDVLEDDIVCSFDDEDDDFEEEETEEIS